MGGSVSVTSNEKKSYRNVSKKDFVFHQSLFKGKFGEVFLASHRKTKQLYAAKEIDLVRVVDKLNAKNLTNEFVALRRLNKHPFITTLAFAFRSGDVCYMIVDLLKGRSLRYFIQNERNFSEGAVAFIVACLSSALFYIHSKGIIHRDIKPETIILENSGYPYIGGFVVSHVESDHEFRLRERSAKREFHKILTCPLPPNPGPYNAPEMYYSSHHHGIAADYWSLGVVAYELMYHNRPFPDKELPKVYIDRLEQHLLVADIQFIKASMLPPLRHAHTDNSVEDLFSDAGVQYVVDANGAIVKQQRRTVNVEEEEKMSDVDDQAPPTPTEDVVKEETPENHLAALVDKYRDLPESMRMNVPPVLANGDSLSANGKDVLQGLLDVRPWYRLGGNKLLLEHPWFRDHNIPSKRLLLKKEALPPFIPADEDTATFEVAQREAIDSASEADNLKKKKRLFKNKKVVRLQRQIGDFHYVYPQHRQLMQQVEQSRKLQEMNHIPSAKSQKVIPRRQSSSLQA
eukprot:CAMPEP_0185017372 /NCGR_PEP_ID=MMETSP1103-20130426/332_1 /TAXON_ID=36769 /ORGANISM="Paraphysomonas bandaiensis, Strain Caron Lab Isolate" /LENGTH=514 /DNA_ID=CAMNT_0027546751 /DNA_START=1 /DNA_END=1545 /DNA_ORIENTATION=-